MIPLFLLKNPMLTLRVGIYAIAIIVISTLLWRVHSLAERTDQQAIELKRYEYNFNELTRLSKMRENIITNDLTTSLTNERILFNNLSIIESMSDEDNCPVAPVLRNAIDSLYNNYNSP